MSSREKEEKKAIKNFNKAYVPTRSLTFFTVTAIMPIVFILALVLFVPIGNSFLATCSLLAATVSLIGFSRLIYELVYDIAGFPQFKLPIWSAVYPILYIISAFTFCIFSLHLYSPGVNYSGINTRNTGRALSESLYLSLTNVTTLSPDASIRYHTSIARYVNVIEGIIFIFIELVILTKIVKSF